jgi:hypothetical protein
MHQATHAIVPCGACNLLFCSSILAIGKFRLSLDTSALQTLAAITLVFSGQRFSTSYASVDDCGARAPVFGLSFHPLLTC